jgi:molybdopterin molybdotransferase
VLTVDEARAAVLAVVRPLGPPEDVPIAAALDRTLAAALRAAGDVPPFASSAMDGWAVRAGAAGRRLRIAGESRAGRPSAVALGDGEAVRISTGGAVPNGAEAVLRVEDSREQDGWVVLDAPVEPGENVRAAGEDQRAGTEVLPAGTRLGPPELAAAVTAGVGRVGCAPRPRVAVLCTGDELRPPGAPLGPGEIHNSNAPALAGMAARAGAEVVHQGVVADDRAATEATLAAALDGADVLCVSGGVSVGPHDHVKPALLALGVRERFWRVSLQPGKPTWFGSRGDQLVFGLPGNPVSTMVTFTLFVGPALRGLQGAAPPPASAGRARLAAPVARVPDREQAVRVVLAATEDGGLEARTTGPQGSHLISSLVGAAALARIPAGAGELPAGAVVQTVAL